MKKKLINFLKFLTKKDKILHLCGGIVLQILFSLIFNADTAIIITLFIGLLKEAIYDFMIKKGKPEIADMIMTWIGGLLIYIII